NDGYKGNGLNCSDINECQSNNTNNCSINTHCNNTIGSYQCICNDGYEGDGLNCSDIDECQSNNTNNCPFNSHCYNTIGSYQCINITSNDPTNSITSFHQFPESSLSNGNTTQSIIVNDDEP